MKLKHTISLYLILNALLAFAVFQTFDLLKKDIQEILAESSANSNQQKIELVSKAIRQNATLSDYTGIRRIFLNFLRDPSVKMIRLIPSDGSEGICVNSGSGCYELSNTENTLGSTLFYDSNQKQKIGEVRAVFQDVHGEQLNTVIMTMIAFSFGVLFIIFNAIFIFIFKMRTEIMRKREDLLFLAHQCAHNIQGPVSSVKEGLSSLSKIPGIPKDVLTTLNFSSSRIDGISNNLLRIYREIKDYELFKPKELNIENSEQSLVSMLQNIVNEKKIQYKSNDGIGISTAFDLNSKDVSSIVNPEEFCCVISNLIDNAKDSIKNGKGSITVTLIEDSFNAVIEIKDTGCGIPKAILPKIGKEGFSYEKDGSGVGVYHAMNSIKRWGGTFEIESKEGRGTKITITLSISSASYTSTQKADAILIDNEASNRMSWLLQAQEQKRVLWTFKSFDEFLKHKHKVSTKIPIYLDKNFEDGAIGFALAKKLTRLGFANITMTTGDHPELLKKPDYIKEIIDKNCPKIEAIS